MRMIIAMAALLASGTAAMAGTAFPASYDYPWCVFGEELGYSGDCSYETRAQCLASASGRSNTYCDVNPRVRFQQQQQGVQQQGMQQYRRQRGDD